MKATCKKHILEFKNPSGTSRGILTKKETWFLILEEKGKMGIGECGLFRGLGIDDVPEYEDTLKWVCANIHLGVDVLLQKMQQFPSIQFGLEQAFISLASSGPFVLFPSEFTENERPIPINGLIWMGDEEFMLLQVQQKLEEGFKCLKMKIGAIDFNREINILRSIRKKYSKQDIEIRVDANGAFAAKNALDKLIILSEFDIHSIEQPIKAGDWDNMKKLCESSPIPIALDEELIGVTDVTKKKEIIQTIRPSYIILKPSLIGGFKGSQEWIDLAKKHDIGWWITSALESNIGLNAIAQWTFTLNNKMPQGLGTGGLFTNNFKSPLEVFNGGLYYRQTNNWKNNLIGNLCI